jgi:hypothetical protein
MENQEVYNIGNDTSEVTIIHKDGLDAKAPNAININGNIDSVFSWLDKRVLEPSQIPSDHDIIQNQAHILVNRDKMSITLIVHEIDPFLKGSISGKLVEHPDFEKWQINTGEDWDHETLSEFIKMNRSCFVSKDAAMKLSTGLKNLKVNVEKELEKENDNRGNYKAIAVQKVKDMSIPDKFALTVPIFKGQDKVHFEVEIYVNPHNYRISLVSPEANDAVSDVRDNIIDEQKEKIIEIAPNLVIIEQ